MNGPRTIRRGALAAFAAATLVLAGCGSSGGSDSSAKTRSTAADGSGSSTSAPKAAAVTIKSDPTLGSILADADGRTLYTLTSGGKAVDCTGACADAWPPATADAGTKATVGGVEIATADGTDGATVLTAGGLPLYRFQGDASASDAKGEGISNFGGTWHVVKAGSAGNTTTSTDGMTTTTGMTPTTAASGGGDGY
jgi:predicted lipoprotein with Yx(FWY)xxD motif